MYRWQMLTLAKIEAKAKLYGTTLQQVQAVKRVLLDIGIQHFPDPETLYIRYEDKGGWDIWLTWSVDDRKLRAIVDRNAGVQLSRFEGDVCMNDSIAVNPTATEAQDSVRCLLFGSKSEHEAGLV